MAEPICPANAPLSSESMAAKQPKTTPVCRVETHLDAF